MKTSRLLIIATAALATLTFSTSCMHDPYEEEFIENKDRGYREEVLNQDKLEKLQRLIFENIKTHGLQIDRKPNNEVVVQAFMPSHTGKILCHNHGDAKALFGGHTLCLPYTIEMTQKAVDSGYTVYYACGNVRFREKSKIGCNGKILHPEFSGKNGLNKTECKLIIKWLCMVVKTHMEVID